MVTELKLRSHVFCLIFMGAPLKFKVFKILHMCAMFVLIILFWEKRGWVLHLLFVPDGFFCFWYLVIWVFGHLGFCVHCREKWLDFLAHWFLGIWLHMMFGKATMEFSRIVSYFKRSSWVTWCHFFLKSVSREGCFDFKILGCKLCNVFLSLKWFECRG